MKSYIIGYVLFVLIMIGTKQAAYVFEIPTIVLPNIISGLTGLVNFVIIFLNFLVNLILFSVENTFIASIVLVFKILFVLDLVLYGKRVLNPVSN